MTTAPLQPLTLNRETPHYTQRHEFVDNLLIGDKDARGKNALHESRDAIYPYFFEQMNLQAARCVVAGDNVIVRQVLAKRRWIETRVETRQSATGDGTIELHHFRLPRETWNEFRS